MLFRSRDVVDLLDVVHQVREIDVQVGYPIVHGWVFNLRNGRLIDLDIDFAHQRYDRLVELNVQEQCINVIKMDCVQARYVADGYPIVHGWVFNLRNGRLIDLDIDFAHLMDDIQKIYDITDSHWVVNQRKVG